MLEKHTILRTATGLEFQTVAEDEIKISNPTFQTGLTGPQTLLEVLRFFERPSSLSAFREAFDGVPDEVFDELLGAFLLFEENNHRVLRKGFTTVAKNSIGVAARPQDLAKSGTKGFAIVGVGTDVLALGGSGARFGPEEIRSAAGFRFGAETPPAARPSRLLDLEGRRSIDLTTFGVVDLGDVVTINGEPMADYGRRAEMIWAKANDSGFTPIVLGGDHSVSSYALKVVAERCASGFGIIHFDAHHDLYPPSVPDHLTHANPFQEVLKSSALKYFFQVGLRTLEPVLNSKQFELLVDSRLSYISSSELQHRAPREVFAGLPRDVPCYLTFDVDCMAPELCPETGAPVNGGLTYYQARSLVGEVARTFHCVGADFVEVASRDTKRNRAASTVRALLTHFMLSSVPSEELKTYLQVRSPASTPTDASSVG